MSRRKRWAIVLIPILLVGCNLPSRGGNQAADTFTGTSPPLTETATLHPTIDDFFEHCPSAAEIAAVNADLDLRFESDPTAGTLACRSPGGSTELTLLQKRVYLSILVMKALTFDQPLSWTDQPMYTWFVNSVDGMRFRQGIGYSSCCDPANYINIQLADNSYLLLTDKWVDPPMGGGLMDTMVLFVHEARHNNGLPHTCPNGQDDQTVTEMSAWGVQYYLLIWIAQHSDPAFLAAPGDDPDLYREVALGDARMIRNSRFCAEPTMAPEAFPSLVP